LFNSTTRDTSRVASPVVETWEAISRKSFEFDASTRSESQKSMSEERKRKKVINDRSSGEIPERRLRSGQGNPPTQRLKELESERTIEPDAQPSTVTKVTLELAWSCGRALQLSRLLSAAAVREAACSEEKKIGTNEWTRICVPTPAGRY